MIWDSPMTSLEGSRKQGPEISIRMEAMTLAVYYILLTSYYSSLSVSAQNASLPSLAPMNCSVSHTNSCTSYLYFADDGSQQLAQIAKDFNVDGNIDIFNAPATPIPHNTTDYMIAVNCSCDRTGQFFAQATYTPNPPGSYNFTNISEENYGNLAFSGRDNGNNSIQVQLLCGCPPPGWSAIIAYIIRPGDTVFILNTTFSSNEVEIKSINGITDINTIVNGDSIFIPINTKPTDLAKNGPRAAPPPPGQIGGLQSSISKRADSKIGLIVGIVTGVVALFLILATLIVCHRKRNEYIERRLVGKPASNFSGSVAPSSSSTVSSWSVPRNLGFLGSWCNFVKPSKGSVNDNVKRSITLPREAMNVFDQEKPVVFNYEEIIGATGNFNKGQKLGQGAFGTVYSGTLREQEVAIKQMKATKSREFLAELKVLCKVHHTNLVELIGYSAGEQSLFLIYEFAENGALSDHLHNPFRNQYAPLSWTARVQIALDAARGLEYIHEHTKTHYVHRDVKTSNILLDGHFRAKVADFGLAKLVEQSAENLEATTRVVGTFGYMAPEYVLDGHATSKTDVYAFGVVLFELLTGLEALQRTNNTTSSPQGRRALTSRMLSVLKEKEPEKAFKNHVDQLLGDIYPLDCAYKMARLAEACVSEEPSNRPDMRQIVFTLSQTLLVSIEWEASLAGSSQIFSGLVQGR